MRKGGVLIGFFLLFSLLIGVSQDSQKPYLVKGAGFSQSIKPLPIPLSCMNKITFEVRVTNTEKNALLQNIHLENQR